MSAGRGWIAVVAVLLSRGRPWPLFLIAVVFGVVDSLSFRVQGLGLPQQFTEMMPYLTTLAVLVLLSNWPRKKEAGGRIVSDFSSAAQASRPEHSIRENRKRQ
jgi:simple sugar transport system permease protein